MVYRYVVTVARSPCLYTQLFIFSDRSITPCSIDSVTVVSILD